MIFWCLFCVVAILAGLSDTVQAVTMTRAPITTTNAIIFLNPIKWSLPYYFPITFNSTVSCGFSILSVSRLYTELWKIPFLSCYEVNCDLQRSLLIIRIWWHVWISSLVRKRVEIYDMVPYIWNGMKNVLIGM